MRINTSKVAVHVEFMVNRMTLQPVFFFQRIQFLLVNYFTDFLYSSLPTYQYNSYTDNMTVKSRHWNKGM